MCFQKFQNDESGAITVDWVVLTAAIVGIAIAVLLVIAGGINTSATTTTATLSSADSVSGLINGGASSSSYSSWQDYLDGNGGDIQAAALAANADAPDGYQYVGAYDNATGAPIYQDSNDSNNLSVAGESVSYSDYTGGDNTWTYTNNPV